jgi:hypothetical protein
VQVNLFESADGHKEQAMAEYIFGVLGREGRHTGQTENQNNMLGH